MPDKLKRLSARDLIRIFHLFNFDIYSQRGSHLKMRRINEFGNKENITFPNHDELDMGTLRAIYRQALRYIPKEDLFPYFYGNS